MGDHESAAVKNRLSVLGQTPPSTPKGHAKTKFLALDKCLPRRQFLQVLDIPTPSAFNTNSDKLNRLCLDPEWLCILKSTDHLLNLTPATCYMPSKKGSDEERHDFSPSEQEIEDIFEEFGGDLKIPENFEPTVEAFDPQLASYGNKNSQPVFQVNPQTTLMCAMLGIRDVTSEILKLNGGDDNQASKLLLQQTLAKIDEKRIEESKANDEEGSDVDSESEEQRLLFEALRSRRAKEATEEKGPSSEFPTFIADDPVAHEDDVDDDDDDDDDDVQVTTTAESKGATEADTSLDFMTRIPAAGPSDPLVDVSPIKKRLDLDSSIGADQASKETEFSAPEGSVVGVKRASTEDASTPTVSEEKPKKQFKRRNVALYSALSTDDE